MKKIFLSLITLIVIVGCHPKEDELYKPIKIADSLAFPEGPAWDGVNTLYSSNCYGGWITRIKNNEVDTLVSVPTQPYAFGKTNGLAFHQGYIYACDYGNGAILKIEPRSRDCFLFCEGYDGKKFNRPNDLAFNSKGDLYFTDPSSYDKEKKDGVIYRIKNGTNIAEPLFDSLAFCNGIAFSADEKFLYVCESVFNRVLKFAVDEEGQLQEPTTFAEIPGGDPDGIAFDQKGNLYVAHFGGSAVYVFDANGKEIRKIVLPGKKPSNVEFGGEDMKTLFITECEKNELFKVRVEIAGLKLNQ
ncbi:MAG: SMP-30/gluconolactonase/LRE family protein [Melioribacteraceae bacterium]|nr:SMP-30/gluconolactonase/LRE family protein [Melioribacteraceae bacterium]